MTLNELKKEVDDAIKKTINRGISPDNIAVLFGIDTPDNYLEWTTIKLSGTAVDENGKDTDIVFEITK